MAELKPSAVLLLDVFTQHLTEAVSNAGYGAVEAVWRDAEAEATPEELLWWSGYWSNKGEALLFVGAPAETWESIGRGGASEDLRANYYELLGRCMEDAFRRQLGPGTLVPDLAVTEAPPESWARVAMDINYDQRSCAPLFCVLHPELEGALAEGHTAEPFAPLAATEAETEADKRRAAQNPMSMLMNVEVPVSISFGRTRMRMKELLDLTTGSVVELEQGLGDEVEVRVNNLVIARGEVVAVEGNYGVRILGLVAETAPAAGLGGKATL